MKRTTKPAKDRFEEKVFYSLDGCHYWLGTINKDGYGKFRYLSDRTKAMDSAHRGSWMIYRGHIPNSLHVLHTCDHRSCVNPYHLFLGTNRDNIDDMMRKCRSLKGRPRNKKTAPHI